MLISILVHRQSQIFLCSLLQYKFPTIIMINEETFVRQVVKIKPHHQDLEESVSAADEEASSQELQSRRQSLPSDGCQSYDIFMKVNSKSEKGQFRNVLQQVMLLGDSGVGKTCLLMRFRDGFFLAGNFISTVGVDFRVRDGKLFLLICVSVFSTRQYY